MLQSKRLLALSFALLPNENRNNNLINFFHLSESFLTSGLNITNPDLLHAIRSAQRNAETIFDPNHKLSLDYSIFQSGTSALRNASPEECNLLQSEPGPVRRQPSISSSSSTPTAAFTSPAASSSYNLALATLFFLAKKPDMAHEMILGVTLQSISQAEYAATHPGETNWSKEHPLSSSSDLLHAVLHRLEGEQIGEGGHCGYENSKFWLAGGPKCLDSPAHHVVRDRMKWFVEEESRRLLELEHEFSFSSKISSSRILDSLVAPFPDGAHHSIIQEGERGETKRTVWVPPGEFDGFQFCNVCQRRYADDDATTCDEEEGAWSEELRGCVDRLQLAEVGFILREELKVAFGLALPKESQI